jgi:hypothetical protein
VWSDDSKSCVLLNPQSNKLNIIVSLITDVILLFIMVGGLFRMHLQVREFGLGRLLWSQVRLWRFLLVLVLVTNLNFRS